MIFFKYSHWNKTLKMLESFLVLSFISHCYLSSISSFCNFSFLLELRTNFVFHHYLGLHSVGKEVRSMGVDKHKDSIHIKLAFEFFNLPRRVTVGFGRKFILLQYRCPVIQYFLHDNHCEGVLLGFGDVLVRKTRQEPGPTKGRIYSGRQIN